ncbi:MAG: tetratricopeptide repeat protein [Acidobacteriota bacterium]
MNVPFRLVSTSLTLVSCLALTACTSPPAYEPPPLATFEQGPAGEQRARLDPNALAAWARRQELPEPPQIDLVEPAVADVLLGALSDAAERRDGASYGLVGMACESLEAHRSAEAYFELAREAEPQDFRWVYYLACIHQVTGRDDSAHGLFLEALEIDASYPTTHARLAELELDAGRLGEAAQSFERYRQLVPQDWLGEVGLARVALERAQAAEALTLLERAAQKRADDFQVQHYLGRALAALGREDEARAALARAAELPKGAWFQARDRLDQELHAVTDSTTSLVEEFERLSKTQDWPALVALGEQVVAKRPGDKTMWLNLVSLYRKLGRVDDAEAAMRRAEALPGKEARVPVTRAELELARSRAAEALVAAEEALALESDSLRARAVKGRSLILLGRYGEAEAELLAVRAGAPTDAGNEFALGELYRGTGRKSEAITCYRRCLELQPGMTNARVRLRELGG